MARPANTKAMPPLQINIILSDSSPYRELLVRRESVGVVPPSKGRSVSPRAKPTIRDHKNNTWMRGVSTESGVHERATGAHDGARGEVIRAQYGHGCVGEGLDVLELLLEFLKLLHIPLVVALRANPHAGAKLG